jgi:hypothetical protein
VVLVAEEDEMFEVGRDALGECETGFYVGGGVFYVVYEGYEIYGAGDSLLDFLVRTSFYRPNK